MTTDRQRAPLRAGGLDWAAYWRGVVEHRRARIEALPGRKPEPGYWDRRAGWFARLNREVDAATDPLVHLVAEALGEGGTLLDVGAGTGRYALPLAASADRVTAVEPSAGMRAFLEREAAERGLGNVATVGSGWEDAAVEPHDVVLCCHVLNPIAEVVPFIEKLDAHVRRACYLVMRVDQMVPELEPLWREVWGEERPPEPTALDLFGLVHALGFPANFRLVPFAGPGPYDDLDDAVERVRQLLFLPSEPDERDEVIRPFLASTLVRRGAALDWPVRRRAGVVWWER